MKRYSDYSNRELAVMDDANIQRLIDLELAIEGVRPVPQPSEHPEKQVELKKVEQAFAVGGLIFKNQEDANVVAKMELLATDYDYSGAGYNYCWLKPLDAFVKVVTYFTEDEVRRFGQQIRDFDKRKGEYDKEVAEWNKYQSRVSAITETVWKAIRAAYAEMEMIQAACKTLNNYIDLADGDEATAKAFFRNTYKDFPVIIAAVIGEEKGENEDEESEEA